MSRPLSKPVREPLRGFAARRAGRTAPRRPRRFVEWFAQPIIVLVVAGILGLVLGIQFFKVNPRIIKVAIAGSFAIMALRYPAHVGVGMFLLVYPFPSAIFIGNTNFIFAILLLCLYVVKFSRRTEPAPGPTLLGGGILMFLVAHLLSFLVLDEGVVLRQAVESQQYLFASVLLYVLMANVVKTPKRLLFIFQVMTASAAMIYLIQVIEFVSPGLQIVPRWYLSSPALGADLDRASGVFRSHALLADSAAVNVVLQLFLMTRARGRLLKFYHGAVGAVAVTIIFMAANRGALIILLIGLVILAWYLRREIQFSYLAVMIPVFLIVLVIANEVTRERLGDVTLLTRVLETRFDTYMPEHRAAIWANYMKRIPDSLILGHGPLINYAKIGVWPHNAYIFYAYTVGVVGLGCFLWVWMKAIIKTRPRTRVSWKNDSFVRGAMLVVHVGLIMFAIGQLRTDHQRGNVAIYYTFTLLGLAAVVHFLRRQETAPKGERAVDSRGSAVVAR